MIRFGLIGHGRFGKHYERLLGELPDVKLIGIATRHTTISIDEVLRDADAVIIATPASTHAELIARALKANKHILVEKPMVMSMAEAKSLQPLLTDKIFMVGYQYLYNDSIRTLSSAGTIAYLGEHFSNGPIRDDIGVFADAGVHDLSIIEYLFRPGEIVATHGSITADVAAVTISFENGLLAQLVVSRVFPEKVRRITLLNMQGGTVYDDLATQQKREPLRNELEHFIDCVHNKKQPLTDFAFGLKITEHCEAIYRKLQASSFS